MSALVKLRGGRPGCQPGVGLELTWRKAEKL